MSTLMSLPIAQDKPAEVGNHLSFSSVRLFQTCSLRWFFRYVAKAPEECVSSSLLVGQSLHAAVQHHFEELLIGNTPPSLDTLLEVFWDAWNFWEGPPVQFASGEDINSIARLAERMLRTFQASDFSHPAGNVLGVEEEVNRVWIEGIPPILARLDLLVDTDDALVLTDFKSARSAWSANQVEDAADQLLLYHDLIRPLAGDKPIHLQFAVLTKTKVPSLTLHPVNHDERQLRRTRRTVEKVWQAIQSGVYFPSPSPMNCGSCPYRGACRAWAG